MYYLLNGDEEFSTLKLLVSDENNCLFIGRPKEVYNDSKKSLATDFDLNLLMQLFLIYWELQLLIDYMVMISSFKTEQ